MTEAGYDAKFQEMQRHIPFIQKVIEKLKIGNSQQGENPRKAQLEKMEMLLELLLNPQKKLKMETLEKCEAVLIKLHTKIEKHSTFLQNEDPLLKSVGTTNSQFSCEAKATTSKQPEPLAPDSPSPVSISDDDDYVTPVEIPTERRDSPFELWGRKRSPPSSSSVPSKSIDVKKKNHHNYQHKSQHSKTADNAAAKKMPYLHDHLSKSRDSKSTVIGSTLTKKQSNATDRHEIAPRPPPINFNKATTTTAAVRHSEQMKPSSPHLQLKVVTSQPLPVNVGSQEFSTIYKHLHEQQKLQLQKSSSHPSRNNVKSIELHPTSKTVADQYSSASTEAYNPAESWDSYNESQKQKKTPLFTRSSDRVTVDDKKAAAVPSKSPTRCHTPISDVLKSPPLSFKDINKLLIESGGDQISSDMSEIGTRRPKKPKSPETMMNSLDFVRRKFAQIAKITTVQLPEPVSSPTSIVAIKNDEIPLTIASPPSLSGERLALKYNPHPRQERRQSMCSNESSDCSQLSVSANHGFANAIKPRQNMMMSSSGNSATVLPVGVNVLPTINSNDPRLRRKMQAMNSGAALPSTALPPCPKSDTSLSRPQPWNTERELKASSDTSFPRQEPPRPSNYDPRLNSNANNMPQRRKSMSQIKDIQMGNFPESIKDPPIFDLQSNVRSGQYGHAAFNNNKARGGGHSSMAQFKPTMQTPGSGQGRFNFTDNVESKKHFEAKQNKNQPPRTYKEFREAKEEANRRAMMAKAKADKKREHIEAAKRQFTDDKKQLEQEKKKAGNKITAASSQEQEKRLSGSVAAKKGNVNKMPEASDGVKKPEAGESTLDKMYRTQNFTTEFPKATISFKIPKKKAAEEATQSSAAATTTKAATSTATDLSKNNQNIVEEKMKKNKSQQAVKKPQTNKEKSKTEDSIKETRPAINKIQTEIQGKEAESVPITTKKVLQEPDNDTEQKTPRTNQTLQQADAENRAANSRDPRFKKKEVQEAKEAEEPISKKPPEAEDVPTISSKIAATVSADDSQQNLMPRRISRRRCTMMDIGSAPLVDKDKLLKANALMLEDIEERDKLKRKKEEDERQMARRSKNLADMFQKTDDNCTVSTQNIISGKRRTRATINFNETQNAKKVFQAQIVPETTATSTRAAGSKKSIGTNEDAANTREKLNKQKGEEESKGKQKKANNKANVKNDAEVNTKEATKEDIDNVTNDDAAPNKEQPAVQINIKTSGKPKPKTKQQPTPKGDTSGEEENKNKDNEKANKPNEKQHNNLPSDLLENQPSTSANTLKPSSISLRPIVVINKIDNEDQSCAVTSSTSVEVPQPADADSQYPTAVEALKKEQPANDDVPSSTEPKSSNSTPTPAEDESRRHDFLNEFVHEIIKPNADQKHILNLLGQILDEDKLQYIKTVIESTAKNAETTTAAASADKAMTETKETAELPSPEQANKTIKIEENINSPEGDGVSKPENESSSPSEVSKTPNKSKVGMRAGKKKRNELDRLNEDIRDMFIREGVLTATGRRMCTLMQHSNKESPTTAAKTNANRKACNQSTEIAIETDAGSLSGKGKAARIVKRKPPPLRRSMRATKAAVEPTENEKDNEDNNVPALETEEDDSSNSDKRQMPVLKPHTPIKLTEVLDLEVGNSKKRKSVGQMGPNKAKKTKAAAQVDEFAGVSSDSETENEAGPEVDTAMTRPANDPNTMRNDNVNWHNQSKCTSWCMICKKRITPLYSSFHYKMHHGENFISRLAPVLLQKFKQGKLSHPLFGVDRKQKQPTWFYRCPFCLQYFNTPMPLWLEHLQNHTSEFRYECSKCHKGSNKVTTTRRHISTTECKGAHIVNSSVKLVDPQKINGNVCHLCNFIQLKRANLERHYIEQHSVAPENVHILGYTITLFDCASVEMVTEQNALAKEEEIRKQIECEEKIIDIEDADEEEEEEAKEKEGEEKAKEKGNEEQKEKENEEEDKGRQEEEKDKEGDHENTNQQTENNTKDLENMIPDVVMTIDPIAMEDITMEEAINIFNRCVGNSPDSGEMVTTDKGNVQVEENSSVTTKALETSAVEKAFEVDSSDKALPLPLPHLSEDAFEQDNSPAVKRTVCPLKTYAIRAAKKKSKANSNKAANSKVTSKDSFTVANKDKVNEENLKEIIAPESPSHRTGEAENDNSMLVTEPEVPMVSTTTVEVTKQPSKEVSQSKGSTTLTPNINISTPSESFTLNERTLKQQQPGELQQLEVSSTENPMPTESNEIDTQKDLNSQATESTGLLSPAKDDDNCLPKATLDPKDLSVGYLSPADLNDNDSITSLFPSEDFSLFSDDGCSRNLQDELLTLAEEAANQEIQGHNEVISAAVLDCVQVNEAGNITNLMAKPVEAIEAVTTNKQPSPPLDTGSDNINTNMGNIISHTVDMYFEQNKRKSVELDVKQNAKKICAADSNVPNAFIPSIAETSNSPPIQILARSIISLEPDMDGFDSLKAIDPNAAQSTSITERLSQRLKLLQENAAQSPNESILPDDNSVTGSIVKPKAIPAESIDSKDDIKLMLEKSLPKEDSQVVAVISDDEDWEDIEITETAPITAGGPANNTQKQKGKGIFQKFGLFKPNASKARKNPIPMVFLPKKKLKDQKQSASPTTTKSSGMEQSGSADNATLSTSAVFKPVLNIMDDLLPDSPSNDPIDLVPELTPLEPLTDLSDISSYLNCNLSLVIDESQSCIQDALDLISEQQSQEVLNKNDGDLAGGSQVATKAHNNKIEHIGFSVPSSQIGGFKFYCLVESCSFLFSNDAMGLEDHFQSDHKQIKWSGYCAICQVQCEANNAPHSVAKEIKHMTECHVNACSFDVCSNSNDSSEKSQNAEQTSETKPRLMLRRLSGDMLSTSNSESSMPSNSHNQIPATSTPPPITGLLGALLNAKPKPPTKDMPPQPKMPLTEPLLMDNTTGNSSFNTLNNIKQQPPFIISNIQSLRSTVVEPTSLIKVNKKTYSKSSGKSKKNQQEQDNLNALESSLTSLEVSQILATAGQPSIGRSVQPSQGDSPVMVSVSLPVGQAQAGDYFITQTLSKQFDANTSGTLGLNISIEMPPHLSSNCNLNKPTQQCSSPAENVIDISSPTTVTDYSSYIETTSSQDFVEETVTSRFYKCVGSGCKFTSRVPVAMSEHLRFHERKNFSSKFDFFECGFCQYQATDVDDYMRHADQYHIISKNNKSTGQEADMGQPSTVLKTRICDILKKKIETTNTKSAKELEEQRAFEAAQRERDYFKNLRSTVYEIVKPTGLPDDKLYRCVIKNCRTQLTEGTFYSHIMYHVSTLGVGNSTTYFFKCPHCSAQYHRASGIKAHIKNHARSHYFCYMCDETFSNAIHILKHFNEKHWQAQDMYTKELLKPELTMSSDGSATVQDSSYFVAHSAELSEAEVRKYGEKLIGEWQRKKAGSKTQFKSSEIDLLPIQPIFQREVKCGDCEYKTKVRTNMYRHLLMHKQNADQPHATVANVDPVNPVPCLNSNERFFDKMTNLASSSLVPSLAAGGSSSSKALYKLPYAYVPDDRRFKCGVPKCSHTASSEEGFRHHLTTMHSDSQIYRCHFCHEELCKRVLAIDKILSHLRYHSAILYRCEECNYVHNLSFFVERHAKIKHATIKTNLIKHARTEENAVGTTTICGFALGKNYKEPSNTTTSAAATAGPTAAIEQTVAKPIASVSSSAKSSKSKWLCSICNHKATSLTQIQQHCQNAHGQNKPYQCMHCQYGSQQLSQILFHIDEQHNGMARVARYIYVKVKDSTEDAVDTRPLWQRNDPKRVKHIRGILMENEEESEKYRQKLGIDKDDVMDDEEELMLSSSEENAHLDGADILQRLEFSCYHCQQKLRTFDEMTEHNKSHSQNQPLRPLMFRALKLVSCPECFIFTANFSDVQLHLINDHRQQCHYAMDPRTEQGGRSTSDEMACPFCVFSCTHRWQLEKHFQNNKYEHSPRDVPIANDAQAQALMKLGSAQNYFICSLCHDIFANQAAMVQHARLTHANEENFSFRKFDSGFLYLCAFCPHTYNTELALFRHMIDHLGHFKQCRFCQQAQDSFVGYMQHCYAEHRVKMRKFRDLYHYKMVQKFLLQEQILFPNGLITSRRNLMKTLLFGGESVFIEFYEELYKISQQPPIPRLSIARLVARKSTENFQSPSDVVTPSTSVQVNATNAQPTLLKAKKITKRRCTVAWDHEAGSAQATAAAGSNTSSSSSNSSKKPKLATDISSSSGSQAPEFNVPLGNPMRIKKRRRTMAFDMDEKPSATFLQLQMPAASNELERQSPNNQLEPEYSFYGRKPEQLDLSKIYTKIAIGGVNTPLSIAKFRLLFNIDAKVILPRCDEVVRSQTPSYVQYQHISRACPASHKFD